MARNVTTGRCTKHASVVDVPTISVVISSHATELETINVYVISTNLDCHYGQLFFTFYGQGGLVHADVL